MPNAEAWEYFSLRPRSVGWLGPVGGVSGILSAAFGWSIDKPSPSRAVDLGVGLRDRHGDYVSPRDPEPVGVPTTRRALVAGASIRDRFRAKGRSRSSPGQRLPDRSSDRAGDSRTNRAASSRFRSKTARPCSGAISGPAERRGPTAGVVREPRAPKDE